MILSAFGLLFICSLFAFCIKRWKLGVSLCAIVLVINVFAKVIAFQPFHQGTRGAFKVLSFNVHSPGDAFDNNKNQIFSLVLGETPDFVYLPELGQKGNDIHSSLKEIYPFTNAPEGIRDDQVEPIYSKWPIDTIEVLTLPHYYHSIYRVEISKGIDTVSVYCCHLSSNLLFSIGGKYKSLQESYRRRALEADALYCSLKQDPYPSLVVGDMNDISGSYTVRRIEKAGMKDAWWKGGLGYGATYHDHGLRLRLDHILYDDSSFQLCDIKTVGGRLSDHKGLVASFQLLPKN